MKGIVTINPTVRRGHNTTSSSSSSELRILVRLAGARIHELHSCPAQGAGQRVYRYDALRIRMWSDLCHDPEVAASL